MTIARDLGYDVEVGNILRSDLYTADEAFLSGTAAEVVPIRSVDDREIGRPGPITRSIQEASQRTTEVSKSVGGVSEGADATGAAASGVSSAAEALGAQAEGLRGQVRDFLAKIRAA